MALLFWRELYSYGIKQCTVPSVFILSIHSSGGQLMGQFTFTKFSAPDHPRFIAFLTVQSPAASQFPDASIRLRISQNIPPLAACATHTNPRDIIAKNPIPNTSARVSSSRIS